MTSSLNYKSYSYEELLEAHESIDRKSFPERFKELELEIESRIKYVQSKEATVEKTDATEDSSAEYIPNEVPIWDQIKNILLSMFVIVFGGIGVVKNDLAVKMCRHCENVYHLKDEAALVMYAAMLLMSAGFIAEVVDHYDKRNNEHMYHRISNYTMLPGIGLFILAMYLHTQ